MGWLTAIGAGLGFIDSNETASELARDLSNGVDVMFYTEEEEAIGNAETAIRKIAATEKAMETWLKITEVMKSSEVYRSVTRRRIAGFVVFNLMCMIWLGIWVEFAATFGWTETQLITTTVDELTFTPLTWSILKIASVFELGWVFCTIIVFYFGPQLVQMMRTKKEVK
ncbi:MAG: hypothetical protein KAH23_01655 [Kiritimatiellae bacterium]|nr:hypothetical protein [Kiritimatiellia bacterium]